MTSRSRHPWLPRPVAVLAVVATALVPLISSPSAQAATPGGGAAGPGGTARTVVTTGGARHTLGLKPPAGHRIAAGRRVSALGIAAAEVLPASVDLTSGTVTPGDQGPIGSCVAWSEGYTLAGYYANAQRRTGAPFAPMYLYSQVHVTNTASGGGATTTSAWNVLSTQGIAERAVYSQGDYDFRTLPTPAQVANAAGHRMAPARYLFVGANQGGAGITAIKAALASGNPVEIGIPVYSAFMSLDPGRPVMTLSMATGSVLGGHAIAAVGYNATGLVIENSWGSAWGAGGYATLGWDFVAKYVGEASVTTGFASAPVYPVVNGVSAGGVSAAGGETLTLTGTGLAAVDGSAADAVRLVNVADPGVAVNAPVVSRTATTLTVTVPPAPAVDGVVRLGAYRVVVTSPAGASSDNGTKDDVTYLAPVAFTVAGPARIPAATGARITLTGSGFGTSPAAAAALKLAVTVGGRAVPLTWVGDDTLSLTVPPGVPGQSIPIVLTRAGLRSATDATLTYAAHLTALTLRSEASGARTASVTGRGLLGATGWTLTSPDGARTTSLPVVTSTAGLSSAGAGVLITGDTAATVRLPLSAPGGAGAFRLSFTPSAQVYPGAAFLPTPVAVVPYAAPTVVRVTGPAQLPAAGGGALTLTGTNLTAVDRGRTGSVRLVAVADDTVGVDVPITAVTPSTLTLAVPPAPARAGAAVTGAYRLVVTTAQGSLTLPMTYAALTAGRR
jgi:Papain family cysteine protease/IPT/TIG domain